MEKLFVLDQKDYEKTTQEREVYTVRAIIEKNGRLAMQQDAQGEYKIPGGGVEPGETYEDTLIREVLEETGLSVRPETIREIGEIEEIRRDIFQENIRFHRHSYFYSCEVKADAQGLHMTASEIEKGFHLAWATPQEIVETNEKIAREPWNRRDTEFMKMYADRG